MMQTTMENCADMEAWWSQITTFMATVASLQATPSLRMLRFLPIWAFLDAGSCTVNCVAEMLARVPQAEKEIPTPISSHEN